ncbi:MAG: 4-hydroxythreonine-4-phosphate dehydrogenase PdxA [Pseudomonadota bacterium]
MRPILLTQGDPAGIGPEIALRAFAEGDAPFVYLGSGDHISTLAHPMGIDVHCVAALDETRDGALLVLDHPLAAPVVPGRPDPANAAATVEIIARGVELATSGAAAAIVTNPINKKALKDGAGFKFPGHTEFLGQLCGVERPVMMLASPELRVVPVTIHIALAEVPSALTPTLLEETLRTTADALRNDFGIAVPRISVAGLNPHAGEGGAMGREELEVIAPVLERLRAEGMAVDGPRSADTMFHPAARAHYDAAVCMFHDQALIPIKTVDFAGGVNVTLGLPIVRTSPDHGTAYDIAGKDIADPTSLIAALRLAREIAATRAA